MNNLELIAEILSLEERAIEVLMEMKKKHHQEKDGYIMIKYKKGKVSDIGSHKNL